MVDNCKHVRRLNVAKDHSILNPQKWLCGVCGTTESVWACLGCSSVACGRYIEEHALIHYNQTKHPLSIEVNEKYVYCYDCDEYVLNDNAAGDLKLLRNALSAVTTQNLDGLQPRRGKRMLRSKSFSYIASDANKLIQADKCHTAIVHRRVSLLQNVFSQWKDSLQKKRPDVFVRKPPPPRKTPSKPPPKPRPSTAPAGLRGAPRKRKRTIVPGVVGLRNLGNTCYMNAILQVLSSLDELRQYFASEQANGSPEGKAGSPRQSERLLQRQTTVECLKMVNNDDYSLHKGGLNGGGTVRRPKHKNNLASKKSASGASSDAPKSLSKELHALFRVMWSGELAIVSPHSLLHTVWNVIPFFKGYSQQDAQEFMCEFLDKVENEIQNDFGPRRELMRIASNVVRDTFQGEIVSQVTCHACENTSRTYEPFYDLSLEFPDRYQMTRVYRVVSEDSCHLTEMLAKFTEEEELEGKIYSCSKCNLKRRRASHKPVILTKAKKQLLLSRLPKVLRLHLKRFRWSGRNHREKINVHVTFDRELDMAPFIATPYQENGHGARTTYQLSAVVIHHGRGFSSGHYTAYCWNDEANSWVHCNDARVEPCQLPNVLRSQAYILLYTLKGEKIQLEQLKDLQNDLVSEVKAEIQELGQAMDDLDEDSDPEISFRKGTSKEADSSTTSPTVNGDVASEPNTDDSTDLENDNVSSCDKDSEATSSTSRATTSTSSTSLVDSRKRSADAESVMLDDSNSQVRKRRRTTTV